MNITQRLVAKQSPGRKHSGEHGNWKARGPATWEGEIRESSRADAMPRPDPAGEEAGGPQHGAGAQCRHRGGVGSTSNSPFSHFLPQPFVYIIEFHCGGCSHLEHLDPSAWRSPGQLQILRTFVEQIDKWELEMTACECLCNYENKHRNFKYMPSSNLLKCKISNI